MCSAGDGAVVLLAMVVSVLVRVVLVVPLVVSSSGGAGLRLQGSPSSSEPLAVL